MKGKSTPSGTKRARGLVKGTSNADPRPLMKGTANADPRPMVKGTANADPRPLMKTEPGGAGPGARARPGEARPPAPDERGDGRGSPAAVEKRRAARRFNELMLGGGGRAGDGRTERRRRRLLEELAAGVSRRGRRALKPIDVLSRVEELLVLGEPLASIRKACPPPRPVEITAELLDGLRRLHRAYGFSADTYPFVGVDATALRKAGVVAAGERAAEGDEPARRGAA